jgi:hypothetical protein
MSGNIDPDIGCAGMGWGGDAPPPTTCMQHVVGVWGGGEGELLRKYKYKSAEVFRGLHCPAGTVPNGGTGGGGAGGDRLTP